MTRLVLSAVWVVGLVLVTSSCGGGEDLSAGDYHVLVSPPADGGDDAVVSGKVQLVGDCLGIDDNVAFWPDGTKVISTDPLTIDVPGEGRVTLGDNVDGAGGYHYTPDESPKNPGIPDTCPSKSWVEYRAE